MSNILLTGFSTTIIDCKENISEQSPVVLLSLNSNISTTSGYSYAIVTTPQIHPPFDVPLL